MNFDLSFLTVYLDVARAAWDLLDYATRRNVWMVSGLVGALLVFVVWYRWFRCLLGYRKFRGTWYNSHEMQQLVNILSEDQDKGNRVLQHDEVQLLRQWRTGDHRGLGFDSRNHA